jgi:hypothetical protein
VPAAFIKDQGRHSLSTAERNQLDDFKESVTELFDDGYLWDLRRNIRSTVDDIQKFRRDLRVNRDSLGKRISNACNRVKHRAHSLFRECQGHTYDICVETVSFYNSEFSGPWFHVEQGSGFHRDKWTVTLHLHKSWYDEIGSKGNHFFMVGGHKVFTVHTTPVAHNFKGVDVERLVVVGRRSKAALDREHHRIHDLIEQIPQDERDDPDLNDYYLDLVAQLNLIEGASIADRPVPHTLFLCTSQDQTDLEGNHLKGVGSTPEQAFKLMERRVRDTFVKELAV